eukprot:416878-Hanusia_phi.AAC.1
MDLGRPDVGEQEVDGVLQVTVGAGTQVIRAAADLADEQGIGKVVHILPSELHRVRHRVGLGRVPHRVDAPEHHRRALAGGEGGPEVVVLAGPELDLLDRAAPLHFIGEALGPHLQRVDGDVGDPVRDVGRQEVLCPALAEVVVAQQRPPGAVLVVVERHAADLQVVDRVAHRVVGPLQLGNHKGAAYVLERLTQDVLRPVLLVGRVRVGAKEARVEQGSRRAAVQVACSLPGGPTKDVLVVEASRILPYPLSAQVVVGRRPDVDLERVAVVLGQAVRGGQEAGVPVADGAEVGREGRIDDRAELVFRDRRVTALVEVEVPTEPGVHGLHIARVVGEADGIGLRVLEAAAGVQDPVQVPVPLVPVHICPEHRVLGGHRLPPRLPDQLLPGVGHVGGLDVHPVLAVPERLVQGVVALQVVDVVPRAGVVAVLLHVDRLVVVVVHLQEVEAEERVHGVVPHEDARGGAGTRPDGVQEVVVEQVVDASQRVELLGDHVVHHLEGVLEREPVGLGAPDRDVEVLDVLETPEAVGMPSLVLEERDLGAVLHAVVVVPVDLGDDAVVGAAAGAGGPGVVQAGRAVEPGGVIQAHRNGVHGGIGLAHVTDAPPRARPGRTHGPVRLQPPDRVVVDARDVPDAPLKVELLEVGRVSGQGLDDHILHEVGRLSRDGVVHVGVDAAVAPLDPVHPGPQSRVEEVLGEELRPVHRLLRRGEVLVHLPALGLPERSLAIDPGRAVEQGKLHSVQCPDNLHGVAPVPEASRVRPQADAPCRVAGDRLVVGEVEGLDRSAKAEMHHFRLVGIGIVHPELDRVPLFEEAILPQIAPGYHLRKLQQEIVHGGMLEVTGLPIPTIVGMQAAGAHVEAPALGQSPVTHLHIRILVAVVRVTLLEDVAIDTARPLEPPRPFHDLQDLARIGVKQRVVGIQVLDVDKVVDLEEVGNPVELRLDLVIGQGAGQPVEPVVDHPLVRVVELPNLVKDLLAVLHDGGERELRLVVAVADLGHPLEVVHGDVAMEDVVLDVAEDRAARGYKGIGPKVSHHRDRVGDGVVPVRWDGMAQRKGPVDRVVA